MSAITPAAASAAAHLHPRSSRGPLVVAVGGASSMPALRAARAIAEDGGDVVVVSAVEPPLPLMVGLDGSLAPAIDVEPSLAAGRARVAAQLRDALDGDAAWPIEIAIGEPSRTVVDAARRWHARLIVMATGHHDLATRLLHGETTLRTVRRAAVPVLAVGEAPLRWPPRVVVAATDFSPASLLAARAALDLLASGGTLHLVHAWSRTVVEHPALLAQDDAYERSLPARFARVSAALLERARDATILPAAIAGHPAEAIAAFARAHGADLVVAGRQGHGRLERLLLGRVTTALLRAAPCAVLVTPEPTTAERLDAERTLGGTVESTRREEWPALLDAFSRRNVGRRAAVEIDDPALGAQALATGYPFRGATYDHHDGRVSLMLGDAVGSTRHLTHAITHAEAIAMLSGPDGRDTALSVRSGDGQALLTLLPDGLPIAGHGA